MSNFSLASEFPGADDKAWLALVEKALKGADFDKTLVSETYDGLKIGPLYTRASETAPDTAGFPGASPYTRGFRAERDEPAWHIRQLHAATDPAAANAAILEDLQGGASAIALQIAAPGQAGLELGSPDDLDRALKNVKLDLAGVWLEAGHNAATAAAALQEVWTKRGIDGGKATGGFGCDPLGALARTGGHPLSLEQALEEMTSLAALARDRFPDVTAIRADARPWHDGGASEAQELACLAATTVAYLRALEDTGLSPGDGLAQMEFALACDTDVFTNIAKLRAARALIAHIAEVSDAGSAVPGLRLHATTSQRMLARREPYVNILRTTIAAAAAALGGADSVTVLPFTHAIGQPDAFARRIARNIQVILQEESSLGAVIDPAGGSWYAEDFTRELAERAWTLFQDIEKQGGMAQALAKGYIQKMIVGVAEKRARDVAHGVTELIGVSSFANLAEGAAEAEPYPLPGELEEPAITVEPIPLRRPAEAFERLRDASDAHMDSKGERPRALLVALGPESSHADRATYARRAFAAGGIETVPVEPGGYDRKISLVACICGSDESLEKNGPDAARDLEKAGAKRIFAVGRPGDLRKTLKEAGVDEFLHRGCDMVEVLKDALDVLGVKIH